MADTVPSNSEPSNVDLLIGSDYFWSILGTEKVILWYRSEVTLHLLATFTQTTWILDTLNLITLEWYNTRELTHSKILMFTKQSLSLNYLVRSLNIYY